MSRLSIAGAVGALVAAAFVAAGGCQDGDDNAITTVRAGLGGAGGTPDSPIRGYPLSTTAGPEYNAVVYRAATGNIHWRIGTPLSSSLNMGGSPAPGSAPWGYMRADGVPAVLYIDTNRHVHEITNAGDFDFHPYPISAPLAAPAPANGPVPDVIGYVRSDGLSGVVYRDENNHLIEILSNPGRGWPWVVYDTTSMSGAQVTVGKGTAFPYARSDGYNTLIYVGSDNHIHEMANWGLWWGDYDLTAYTGDTGTPATEPWAYQRSDGWNMIVYIGTYGSLHELFFHPSAGWGYGTLPAASTPQGGPFMRPSAYVRTDGVNAVVYLGSDAKIHQLTLTSGVGWTDTIIPTGGIYPTSQPFARRALGNRNSILFKGENFGVVHGYELSQPSGGAWGMQEF